MTATARSRSRRRGACRPLASRTHPASPTAPRAPKTITKRLIGAAQCRSGVDAFLDPRVVVGVQQGPAGQPVLGIDRRTCWRRMPAATLPASPYSHDTAAPRRWS
jgi:hypothetical protein